MLSAQTSGSVEARLDSAGSSIRSGSSERARALLEPLIAELTSAHDTDDLVRALNHLARASYDPGDPTSSLRYSQRVVEIGMKAKAFGAVASALVVQAIVADQVSPPDTVKSLYERALRFFLLAGDTAACAVVYDNLGFHPLLRGDFPAAIALSEQGLACLRDTTHVNYHRSSAIIESSLCNYHTWSGDERAGIVHGQRSVRHAEQSGDLPQLVHSITQLAGTYVQMRDYQRALPLLLRSDSIARARSMPLNKRRDIPELLSSVYEALGDPENALRYYKERSAVHDSLRNDVVRKELERMQRHQQHVADSLLQVEALMVQEIGSQKKLAEERGRRNMIGALALVAVVVAVSVGGRLRLTRRKNAEILVAQERLIASEKAREAEQVRTRIARDVHDDISSDLTKIGMLGSDVRIELGERAGAAGEKLERIKELSREVGRSLQDVIWAVDPTRDSARELIDRSRAYVERMVHGAGILTSLHLEHTGDDVPIDPATRRDLYLLLKESLNNALKYASASRIGIHLCTNGSGYELRVCDDGCGFDTAAARGAGNGLLNMEERALRLHAQLDITSTVGRGTVVAIHGRWSADPGQGVQPGKDTTIR
ncbi:MAG: hypothetical protein IT227_15820 [Flavobacteriales bacterium]|nr:hypothetical protein [Flavobacteriales bacterium]